MFIDFSATPQLEALKTQATKDAQKAGIAAQLLETYRSDPNRNAAETAKVEALAMTLIARSAKSFVALNAALRAKEILDAAWDKSWDEWNETQHMTPAEREAYRQRESEYKAQLDAEEAEAAKQAEVDPFTGLTRKEIEDLQTDPNGDNVVLTQEQIDLLDSWRHQRNVPASHTADPAHRTQSYVAGCTACAWIKTEDAAEEVELVRESNLRGELHFGS